MATLILLPEMKRTILFSFIVIAALLSGHAAAESVRVACVGNSITYGVGTENPAAESYPAQLQALLGPAYEVGNFGHSGATLLRRGHRPYMSLPEFGRALRFGADIVVIHLGVNDTDPRDWPDFRDDFIPDYLALIDSFRQARPGCRVLVCRLTPIGPRHARFESGTRDWRDSIQQCIATVARAAQAELVDLEAPLYAYPHLLPDALHPSREGAGRLARTVYGAITGRYGGLRMPAVYADSMVLQRDSAITLRGWADAGARIRVSIGGQRHHTQAARNGCWQLTLRPLKAGRDYTLRITDGQRTLTYRGVAAGEVWLCSGQSNMAFRLRQAATAAADVPQARQPDIRLFNMQPRWETTAAAWSAEALDSVNALRYYDSAGWQTCTPRSAADFSAVAYYFGQMLHDSLQVPVGLICNAVGGSPAEAWVDRRTLEHEFPAILRQWTQNDFIQPWVRARARQNMGTSAQPLQRHPYEPCYLFEAGVAPLERFPVRGVIWYQGESNAHNMEAHERLFRLLLQSWRQYWGNDSLPFFYAQLSSLNRPSWPWFRDSQRRLMTDLPACGMAVTSDVGDSLDVHPRQKRPVGRRLARWALNRVYGRALTPGGPLVRQAEARGRKVRLSFDYAEGLTTSDGQPLRTFEVAGPDGVFYPAQAVVRHDAVVVESPQVEEPCSVRYGWQPFTRANLVNAAGLPASTFRVAVRATGR